MKLRLGRGLVGWLCILLLSIPGFSCANDDFDDNDEGVTIEVDQMEEEDSYVSPVVEGPGVYLAEHFDDIKEFNKKWIKSEAKKQGVDETIAKYDGKWEIRAPARKILRDDLGLVLTTDAKHAAISAMLNKPFVFKDKPLIVQYEVTMQEGQSCGGAYLKLLSQGAARSAAELKGFHDQTPYTIMFGPDKCGNDNKLHFIMRHRNPNNGSYEEKHGKKPSERLDELYKDKAPHLYYLEVRPDNTFTVKVDGRVVNSGSLLADMTPAINPPPEVDDPDDVKPQDWDEREKIVDPEAVKPDDWDESAPAQIVDTSAAKPDGWLDDEPDTIPDPSAVKPDDWDEEMDGEWEAPLVDNPACKDAPGCGAWTPPTIPNPNYKGVWKAPLIANPAYRGKWVPRKIPNPDYFRDDHPFRMTPISAVGFELWSMSPLLLFDNVLVTDDPELAALWAQQTFDLKRARLAKDSDSVVDRVTRFAVDNPWVYAVGIVVVFLFVGLFVYLCCGPKPEESEDPKKTDAVTKDDPHLSEGEGEAEGEGDGDGGDAPEDAAAAAAAAARDERSGKASLEQQASDEDAEESPVEDETPPGETQRKRKPRKE